MRIFYLFLILVSQTLLAFGQHDEFLDEEIWYCSKIVLDDDEMSYESLSTDNEYYYGPSIENWHSWNGDEVYSSLQFCDDACSSDIYLMDEGQLQNGMIYCLASDNSLNLNDFCMLFRMFWEETGDYVTLTYEITEEENYKELRITNPDGNQTFYRNVAPLSLENTKFSNLKIYPNPVEEMVYLDNLKGKAEIRIFDLNGTELIRKIITENKAQLQMGFLSKGIYFYELKSEKAVKPVS